MKRKCNYNKCQCKTRRGKKNKGGKKGKKNNGGQENKTKDNGGGKIPPRNMEY